MKEEELKQRRHQLQMREQHMLDRGRETQYTVLEVPIEDISVYRIHQEDGKGHIKT